MSWIDIASAICAQRHCNGPVVTASVDDLHFINPIKLGWVVNLKASLNYVGRTSMECGVRVDAENPSTGESFHAVSAYSTFVCLDSYGKPREVPDLILETQVEKERHERAKLRRKQRIERKKKISESEKAKKNS